MKSDFLMHYGQTCGFHRVSDQLRPVLSLMRILQADQGKFVPCGVFRGGAAFPQGSRTEGSRDSLHTSLAVTCPHNFINDRNEEGEVTEGSY